MSEPKLELLDKINQAIIEIESCRAYDTPDMKPVKANWLGILYNARDLYESLDEKHIFKINFVLCIHYLNYSQIMFCREMAGTISCMAKTCKTVIEKTFTTDEKVEDSQQKTIQNEINDDNETK